MHFVTLTNDDAVPSAVVNLTLADVMLDTDGRDRSFNIMIFLKIKKRNILYTIVFLLNLQGSTLSITCLPVANKLEVGQVYPDCHLPKFAGKMSPQRT